MRIGVLADIHGNIEALKAVLAQVGSLGIEKLLIAGDFVGYYYHPGEVLDVLLTQDLIAVKGNHELYLEAFPAYDRPTREMVRSKYGSGLEKAYEDLSKQHKKWLSGLEERASFVLDGKSILLCHGSFWDIEEYIYDNSPESTWEKIGRLENDIIIMGHTHYPLIKQVSGRIILNPGSVGQPRNGVNGASWALLDTDSLKIELHNSQYDVGSVIREAGNIDPRVPYLQAVLLRGNALTER